MVCDSVTVPARGGSRFLGRPSRLNCDSRRGWAEGVLAALRKAGAASTAVVVVVAVVLIIMVCG